MPNSVRSVVRNTTQGLSPWGLLFCGMKCEKAPIAQQDRASAFQAEGPGVQSQRGRHKSEARLTPFRSKVHRPILENSRAHSLHSHVFPNSPRRNKKSSIATKPSRLTSVVHAAWLCVCWWVKCSRAMRRAFWPWIHSGCARCILSNYSLCWQPCCACICTPNIRAAKARKRCFMAISVGSHKIRHAHRRFFTRALVRWTRVAQVVWGQ